MFGRRNVSFLFFISALILCGFYTSVFFYFYGILNAMETEGIFVDAVIFILLILFALLISNNTEERFQFALKKARKYIWRFTIVCLVVASPGILMIGMDEGVYTALGAYLFVVRTVAVFVLFSMILFTMLLFLSKRLKDRV